MLFILCHVQILQSVEYISPFSGFVVFNFLVILVCLIFFQLLLKPVQAISRKV